MELKTLDFLSCVILYDLGVFGSYFPKLPKCSNTHKTDTTKPSDDLGIRVRRHLMLNEELKSSDYFSCVSVHDLGYLGPVSPYCPNI